MYVQPPSENIIYLKMTKAIINGFAGFVQIYINYPFYILKSDKYTICVRCVVK